MASASSDPFLPRFEREIVSSTGVTSSVLDETSIVLDCDRPSRVAFDELLEIDDVAINVLQDGAVDLRVMARDEFATFRHSAASAGTSSRCEFSGHGSLR